MLNIPIRLLHAEFIRKHIDGATDEGEFLLWMVLIHTHQINLAIACIEGAPSIDSVHPATQRAAAETIAGLWPKREDKERASYVYWYRIYQQKTPYETIETIPNNVMADIEVLRLKLESDPRVKSVTPV